MDKRVDNTRKKRLRIAVASMLLAIPLSLMVWAWLSDTTRHVEVEGRYLSTAKVVRAPFEEMVTADGSIMPANTVIIDAVIGGKVVEKRVEDGAMLDSGDTILVLENTDLQLDILNRETAVLDMMTNIQHTRNLLDQSMVSRQGEFADIEFQLTEAEREFLLNQKLLQEKVIAEQDYQASRNKVEYLRKKQRLLSEAVKRDSIVGTSQIEQMEISLVQARKNLSIMRGKLHDLVVKAPVSGQLSAFDVEVGKLIVAGENIAQLDDAERYKMRVLVDQQHIQKVALGQAASVEINGIQHEANIARIYPTVVNNQFSADLLFSGTMPTGLKRGQQITARIRLSETREVLVLRKGSFFQSTGGRWVFLVDRAAGTAEKRQVLLGRQNPEFYEVLDGLQEGDEVIIGNYNDFKDYEFLTLNE